MALEQDLQDGLKKAMIAKNQGALRALRAVKSAILLAKTETAGKDSLSDDEIIKILQKLAKQREESIGIYEKQNRADLASDEKEELETLKLYLPKPMSDDDLNALVKDAIAQTGASSKADMGKVIGIVMGKAAGKADGKRISQAVAKLLA